MNKIFKQIVSALFLLTAAISANGQDLHPLSMETVLQLAGANNLTVKEYQLKYQQALAEQSKAKEWWLPEVFVGVSTHYLNGAAMNGNGIFFTEVNRDNLWAGLGLNMEIDFNKGMYQPLAAKQKAQAAQYFSIAEKNKAILKAVQTCFDLQTEQLKYAFLQTLVNQSDTLSQQIEVQVKAGLRYQSEYLLAKSNQKHLQISLLQSKMEWQKQSAALANLLNLENNIQLVSADTSLLPLSFEMQADNTISIEKRNEYLGLNSELQSVQTLRKATNEGLLLPKLRLGTDNGAFGAYSKPFYNTYQINASLFWTLPLGRLTYKGDLKQWDVKVMQKQNEIEQFKNQFQQEIATAKAQLQIATEQITVAKEALQLAGEALNQSVQRQKLGTVKPFEVFQAQQFYLQAQMDYLKAVGENNKAYFASKVAEGQLL